MKTRDYIIIGAGITGLAIARELILQEPGLNIAILEKENRIGVHASGRNSGVLHSGIYYPENTLKAEMCAKGARAMAEYCEENGLPIQRQGKVITPVKIEDDPQVDLLYQRAVNNGARVSILDRKELAEIEPAVSSATGRALYSPDTAVIEPGLVLERLAGELADRGVNIHYSSQVTDADPELNQVTVNKSSKLIYRRLINSAGQFTDRIAHRFQVGGRYTILPFKGIYYLLDKRSEIKLNGLVYPLPDLNVPFLGVHSVNSLNGRTYFGPTAIPVFGREHYQGLEGIELSQALPISWLLLQQYLRNNQGFRRFAHEEAGRFLRKKFAAAARALVPELKAEYLLPSSKVGIRAQLLDKKKHQLVMDFLVEKKDNTTHILNAVSPAFTSAFEFAKYAVKV